MDENVRSSLDESQEENDKARAVSQQRARQKKNVARRKNEGGMVGPVLYRLFLPLWGDLCLDRS